jgi:ferric-dicitrate binding protein FerR (iron transport regulator)
MTLHHTPDSDEEVAQLIRAAGTRPAPGADRAARVHDAVAREWRARARARRLRRLTAGGVVLLGVAAAVLLTRRLGSPIAQPPPAPMATVAATHGDVTMEVAGGRAAAAVVGHTVAAGSSIRTKERSRAAVTLLDGGELRVDAKTVATFVDAHTIDLESGAIYIDSGASTPGRFTVKTGSGTVRDIGTRFEVRVGDSNLRGPLTIKVRDGAVQLERADRIDRALAGTELVAHADGTVSTKPLDPFAADWAWTTAAAPTFVVENATLEAFLEWAAREGGWTIEWSDALRQRARTTILHGPIDGLAPADALNVVLPTCGLSPEFVRGTLRLRPLR